MKPISPTFRLTLAIVFSFSLLVAPLVTTSGQGQGKQEKPAQPPPPSIGDAITAASTIGSTVLSSSTRQIGGDPYAEFRNAKYSNEGLVSEQDEMRLGEALHKEVVRKYELINEGLERVNRLGQRAARGSRRPNLVYRFHVIRDREINAFAGPGGYIYVTNALINLANDDELSAVLSHEVGHVVARHSLKTMKQAGFLGGLAGLFGDLTGQLGTIPAQIVASGLLAMHSREEEREADYLGVNNMNKSGTNMQGMVTMFQKLQRVSQTDRDLLGAIFASHPDVQERIDNTRYEIKRIGGGWRRSMRSLNGNRRRQ